MRALLVYPQCVETFWSLKHALEFFLFKKAGQPPLGLLTVASLLPGDWEKRLVDMNLFSLREKDLRWADIVLISAMTSQRFSAERVIERCRNAGVRTVAGGPLFTAHSDDFDGVDHLVLNEAEVNLPPFLDDLKAGTANHIYRSDRWADIGESPMPMWELVNVNRYASLSLQYSRGCPFDCEFCDIGFLYGHRLRTKTGDQVLAELDAIYGTGWRGPVFFADDNFIGNKRKLKEEILPAVVEWGEKRRWPFGLSTQASMDLSDDEDLMKLMARARVRNVFVGIETPDDDSLKECGKHTNRKRDMVACVKKIHEQGLQVQGGFIVGFDSDKPSIFEKQIRFIQESGIAVAMVGLLNALRGTKLYRRLERERRLLRNSTGDNTDCSTNFVTKMHYDTLISGYKKIVSTIYSPKQYYERVAAFLKDYKPVLGGQRFRFSYFVAFLRSMLILGIWETGRSYYWKLFFETLFRRPRLFPTAIALAIYGFHFRKFFGAFQGS